MLEFRRKIIDFGVLFAAITTGVSNLLMLKFGRKIIDFDVLFAAITTGVSIFSWWNLGDCQQLLLLVAKRRFSTILDTDLHLFLSGSRCVDGDFTASDFKARS